LGNKHSQAIKDIDKAIEMDPNNPDAYYNCSKVYAAKGQKKKVEEDIDNAHRRAK
jgi:Tfp pilus assembly protein PilF